MLPDSSILVEGSSRHGLTANLMVNNLVYWDYHRPNGLTAFKHKFRHGNFSDKLYTSSEGFVSVMNFFTNSFLKSQVLQDRKIVHSFMAPTVDSDFAASFVETIEGNLFLPGFIETIVFPLGQCLGLPIMLYVLVMEKEEQLKSLLEIMGLRSINYWKAYVLSYSLMFMVTNLLFYAMGRLLLGGRFFEKANTLLLVSTVHSACYLRWLGSQSNRNGTIHEHFHRS